jgi:hypothetical protein
MRVTAAIRKESHERVRLVFIVRGERGDADRRRRGGEPIKRLRPRAHANAKTATREDESSHLNILAVPIAPYSLDEK